MLCLWHALAGMLHASCEHPLGSGAPFLGINDADEVLILKLTSVQKDSQVVTTEPVKPSAPHHLMSHPVHSFL